MTKAELVAALAEATASPKAEAERHLDALAQITRDTLHQGGEVSLRGVGRLFTQVAPERKLNGPIGQGRVMPERRVARFKVAPSLKDTLRES